MTSFDARLDALGLVLPGPYPPHDPLDAVVVHGGRARTSGQLPRDRDGKSVARLHLLARVYPLPARFPCPQMGAMGARTSTGSAPSS